MSFILIVLFGKVNIMNSSLMSIHEASQEWGISTRRIQRLCVDGRIDGAVRVGKVWVIPRDSDKPVDNRLSGNSKVMAPLSTVVKRVVRKFSQNHAKGDPDVVVYQTMAWFASLLFRFYDGHNPFYLECPEIRWIESEIKRVCPKYDPIDVTELDVGIVRDIKQLQAHSDELMDSMSWAYQYLRKTNPCDLSSTQFFTERYMVSSLVESCGCERGVVLDPACGCGNFLIYVMEKRIHDIEICEPTMDVSSEIPCILESLYGFDIDPFLSALTSLNLKICATKKITDSGQILDIQTIFGLKTNVYVVCERSIGGFLDCDRGVLVRNVTDGSERSLSSIVDDADVILTNPPFKTVKGMERELKDYLKETLPQSKCDLCVAFLLKILSCAHEGTKCGLVLQNSWMFLESFERVRQMVFSQARFNSLVILGSGAFANISGEKASVSLATFVVTLPIDSEVEIINLTAEPRSEKESLLLKGGVTSALMSQSALASGAWNRKCALLPSYSEDIVPYSDYAIPMQGTSTGNSKKLVAFFWEHLNDPSWRLVSKGGGYSRWAGLNCFVVNWGYDGDIVRSTPGSALRNADYFDSTSLVFSDTGTSGLNVRTLESGQIFIASGPGIRITTGDSFAHLGFLNSNYATFCIKQLTPKLTISAGYIGRIPVRRGVIESSELSDLARQCYVLKKNLLSRRPDNYEFNAPSLDLTLDELAIRTFVEDFVDECEKIRIEGQLNELVYSIMDISKEDRQSIEAELGINHRNSGDDYCTTSYIDSKIVSIIDDSCVLKRSKPTRNSVGCDGTLEYICRESSLNPEHVCSMISSNPSAFPLTLSKYRDLVAHSLVMGVIGYSPSGTISDLNFKLPMQLETSGIQPEIAEWVRTRFNKVHESLFRLHPLFIYSKETDSIFQREC